MKSIFNNIKHWYGYKNKMNFTLIQPFAGRVFNEHIFQLFNI